MEAIVYTSNAGHTKEYADMLGEETGLPVYDLAQGMRVLKKNSSVLYLGWLMGGQVKGYKKASGKFQIEAVCGVGMAANGSQLTDIRKANPIPDEIPVFCLQGGFEIEKLSGVYKLMMNTMKKTAGKGLADKKDRTPEEDEMLELLLEGGNKVSRENLHEVLEWIKAE